MTCISSLSVVVLCFRARLAVDVLVAEAQAEDASRASRKAAREVRMKTKTIPGILIHIHNIYHIYIYQVPGTRYR